MANLHKIFMGIDPGGEGFITYNIEEEILFKYLADFKIGKEWSLLELNRFFKKFKNQDIHIVLEDVNAEPTWTAKTNWSLSRIKTALETSFVSFELPYTLVKPRTWQGEMFQGIPEMRKPGKTNIKGTFVKGRVDTKPMSILAAQRLFPDINLAKSERAKVAHDGKSDSLLMWEYCRRKFV